MDLGPPGAVLKVPGVLVTPTFADRACLVVWCTWNGGPVTPSRLAAKTRRLRG